MERTASAIHTGICTIEGQDLRTEPSDVKTFTPKELREKRNFICATTQVICFSPTRDDPIVPTETHWH
jgi:hypothetical protein